MARHLGEGVRARRPAPARHPGRAGARHRLALGLARPRSSLAALLDPARVPPLTLDEWAADASPAAPRGGGAHRPRACAAERLAVDRRARMRRAVASNHGARRCASCWPGAMRRPRCAPATAAIGAHDAAAPPEGRGWVTARASRPRCGPWKRGVLAPDVTRALCEGAPSTRRARARRPVRPRAELAGLVQHARRRRRRRAPVPAARRWAGASPRRSATATSRSTPKSSTTR